MPLLEYDGWTRPALLSCACAEMPLQLVVGCNWWCLRPLTPWAPPISLLQSLDVSMAWGPPEDLLPPHTFDCSPLAHLPALHTLSLRGFAEPCLAGLPPGLRQLSIEGGWSRGGLYRPSAFFKLPPHSRRVLCCLVCQLALHRKAGLWAALLCCLSSLVTLLSSGRSLRQPQLTNLLLYTDCPPPRCSLERVRVLGYQRAYISCALELLAMQVCCACCAVSCCAMPCMLCCVLDLLAMQVLLSMGVQVCCACWTVPPSPPLSCHAVLRHVMLCCALLCCRFSWPGQRSMMS